MSTPPLLDFRSFPESQRAYYEQLVEYGRFVPGWVDPAFIKLAERGGLCPAILAERAFNGYADGNRRTGYDVELTAAVPAILHFLFNVVLRCPDVFAYLDDAPEIPYRDASDERPLPFRLPDEISIEEACTLLPAASRPRSDRRALAAAKLAELGCAFCMFHEVGHVTAGHTEHAPGGLPEYGPTDFSQVRVMQVCEREADVIAAVQLMSLLLSPSEIRDHFRECFELEDDEGLDYNLLSVHIFVLRLLFLYLGQVGADLDTGKNHPHPLVRATYVHATVRLTAAEDLGMDLEILDPMLDYASDEAARVWSELGLSVPALQGERPASWYAESVRLEVERLEDDHREIQPRFFATSWLPEESWVERNMEPPPAGPDALG